MARATLDLATMRRFGFLTLPNYSQIATANAIEACRMANYVTGNTAYDWAVVTPDGTPVAASNGYCLTPTLPLAEAGRFDCVFVCGGVDVRHAVDRRMVDALRRLDRQGISLGSLCTGTFALAEAGLLDDYRCAIHWENLAAIREEFPEVAFVDDLFVIDRDRLTCTGGVAPLDMMLALIRARLGRDVASKVSDQFIVERVRGASDHQHRPRPLAGQRVLNQAAALMAENIETPMAMPEVAEALGISRRQLERLFKRHLGTSPADYYLNLRLTRARELLRLTAMAVTDIGLACGFQSSAHFSTAYKSQFGRPPRTDRAVAARPS
ncbi:GlxA family transcriptional regulator [Zavarzinia sp.]|uniref:GlxA family transcriptional regulator n=1 Tax=Zavarzinia sp. TaxID=2027920 RepID=UPI00356259DD